jgi:hypothetical protein
LGDGSPPRKGKKEKRKQGNNGKKDRKENI